LTRVAALVLGAVIAYVHAHGQRGRTYERGLDGEAMDNHGIHAFTFINRDDKTTLVRWRFVPQDGEQPLSDAELTSMPRNFLEQALITRTMQGPVRWDMWLTIGEAGDPEDDPTLAWPKDRKELNVGTLTIASAMPQKGAGCEIINYDPLIMGEGIAPTDDPVLLFRSPSYALSYIKRLQGL
jgi:catalase